MIIRMRWTYHIRIIFLIFFNHIQQRWLLLFARLLFGKWLILSLSRWVSLELILHIFRESVRDICWQIRAMFLIILTASLLIWEILVDGHKFVFLVVDLDIRLLLFFDQAWTEAAYYPLVHVLHIRYKLLYKTTVFIS